MYFLKFYLSEHLVLYNKQSRFYSYCFSELRPFVTISDMVDSECLS